MFVLLPNSYRATVITFVKWLYSIVTTFLCVVDISYVCYSLTTRGKYRYMFQQSSVYGLMFFIFSHFLPISTDVFFL